MKVMQCLSEFCLGSQFYKELNVVLTQWTLSGYVYSGKEKILEDKDPWFSLPNSLKDLECA